MANKITIDELVTRYIFEVDTSGQKKYDDAVKSSTKTVKKETDKQTAEHKATSKEIARIYERSAAKQKAAQSSLTKATISATKRAETAQKRSARSVQRTVERANSRMVRAQIAANVAKINGDQRALRAAQIAVAREERAKLTAVRRGAQRRERIERRAQRRIRREARRTTRVISREARKAAREVRKANREAAGGSSRADNAQKFAGALGDVSRGAAIAAAAVTALTGATFSFVNAQTAALDTIAKQSKQVGLGAEEYQRLSFAAERSGTSIAGIGTASKKLQSQLLDVAGGGGKALTDALGEIGLSAEDIQGKNFEEQLGIISDAMNNTASDTEKVGIAAKIFGLRAGPDLIPLLNEGAAGIKSLGDAAGDVFTADELAPAEAFQDRMTDLQTTLKQTAGRIALELLPAVESAVNKFREWVKENEPLIQQQLPRLIEFLSTFTKIAFSVIDALLSLVGSVEDLTVVLETLALAFAAVRLAMAGPVGMVAAAALAGVAIGNLMNAFGASDALADFLGQFTALNNQIERFLDLAPGSISGAQGEPRVARGANVTPPGGGEDTLPRDLVEFTKNGESFAVDRETLFDIATGDIKGTGLTQDEALNIVSQLDRKKDPNRLKRAEQRGAAAAAKSERDKKKRGKGKAATPTGLEAQLEQQIKQLREQTELRISAQALTEGKGSEEAFALGREAAKQTEARIRRRFEETGELPIGIARDIEQLARSPAVEESIGRVPPPVISVVNNVNNYNISGNEFIADIEASLAQGVTLDELTANAARAFKRAIQRDLGTAVQNLNPQTRV